LGIAYRWLAHWPEAAYCLTEVTETAGRAGLFAFQADALTELGTLYRLRGEFATARDLLERAAHFYQRAERSEALQRVSAEMIQAAG
jgi:tetratricopeptide (TPR) repeat protein